MVLVSVSERMTLRRTIFSFLRAPRIRAITPRSSSRAVPADTAPGARIDRANTNPVNQRLGEMPWGAEFSSMGRSFSRSAFGAGGELAVVELNTAYGLCDVAPNRFDELSSLGCPGSMQELSPRGGRVSGLGHLRELLIRRHVRTLARTRCESRTQRRDQDPAARF